MSGHSKWAQIKHKKAATDAKKSKEFAKITHLITIAARKDGNPEANPGLREAIAKAREVNMPSDSIQKAIKRGTREFNEGAALEEVLYEAFGPGGTAILVESITDNKNRTLGEIRHIFSKYEVKLADAGSVLWAFSRDASGNWQAKHTIQLQEEDKEKLKNLLRELEDQENTQKITTNTVL